MKGRANPPEGFRSHLGGLAPKRSMHNIHHPNDNLNTWNSVNYAIILEWLKQCADCSGFGCFRFVRKRKRTCWHIRMPDDWEFGQWDRIALVFIAYWVLEFECSLCGSRVTVYPSSRVSGTTLTLAAVVFVAFAYEASNLSWRSLASFFCKNEYDRIAHSTLYKAVHGLGQSLQLKEGIEKMIEMYCPHLASPDGEVKWGDPKSIMDHTRKREYYVRSLLSLLLGMVRRMNEFSISLWIYLRGAKSLVQKERIRIYKLYGTPRSFN